MRRQGLTFAAIIPGMLAAALAVMPCISFAQDESAADKAAVRAAQRQIRSQIPADRIEAVKRLRSAPAQDAVKAIAPLALADPSEDVRRAAGEALFTWRNDRQANVLLLKTLEKETRSNKAGASITAPIITVLLASNSADTERELAKFLDTFASASQDGIATIIFAADELGKQGAEQSLKSLEKIARLKCFSSSFAVRRATVQAMIAIRLPDAVGRLVALLPDVDGEVRGDILRYLASISGRVHGANVKAWTKWWETSKAGFEFPGTIANVAPPPDEGSPSYYGLAIQARRMVFVLDISGSMNGPRIQAAKRELAQAIEALPADASFNIVVFSDQASVWRRGLVPANYAMKKAAENYIYSLRAGGHTAAFDALDAAFSLDVEAIYFLSDGQPNAGKIPAAPAILTTVAQNNRIRRISIYAIGIAPGQPGSPLDVFVKSLAEQNYGAYRRVDQ